MTTNDIKCSILDKDTVVTFYEKHLVADGCSQRLVFKTDHGYLYMNGHWPSYFTFESGRKIKVGKTKGWLIPYAHHTLVEYHVGIPLNHNKFYNNV